MALLLVAIPITQYLTADKEPPKPPQDPDVIHPPDIVEQPPDPPDPEPDPIEDLKEKPLPPDINMMESILGDVDPSGLVNYGPVTLPGGEWENPFVDIEDLTVPPKPIRQQAPTYPPDARRLSMNGEVFVQFLVTPEGRTKSIQILQSTNPLFNESTIAAVRKWLFTPGEKDGRVVTTRVRIKVPFKVN